jgi:hypothetical protein
LDSLTQNGRKKLFTAYFDLPSFLKQKSVCQIIMLLRFA